MNEKEYILVNGRKLRRGVTTGSCAAAAAKAAVKMLFEGDLLQQVNIDTPEGEELILSVEVGSLDDEGARCCVVKDGGDDPDVTTGLQIWAEAKSASSEGIHLDTGEGIGRVTLPGLKVAVGQPAINPVPMHMILEEVGKALPPGEGVALTLWVPGGREVAARTFNPRLGIVGGISIIGTTGRVNPMSEDAWKEALALELKMLAAKGYTRAIYVFGNYGEDFLTQALGKPPENLLKISNYLGYMLEKGVELGFKRVLLAGHLGKMVKVSGGIFHTHSRVADARMEIMAAQAALAGATQSVVAQVMASKTTDGAAAILEEHGLQGVYHQIVDSAARRCQDHTYGRMEVGCLLFHGKGECLAMNRKAESWLEEMRRDNG